MKSFSILKPIITDKQLKKWVIVGAGPAGIAVVGKLLDAGVNPFEIAWIDPAFKVGDLGQKWRTVSSNTKVGLFTKFLNACRSFHYDDCPIDFKLNHLPSEETCLLDAIADPLQWVSDRLKEKVSCLETMATEIAYSNANNKWQIKTLENTSLYADKVVLAIGAEPSTLPLSGPSVISVEQMVDLNLLKKVCTSKDKVAVFGSSHTAIIALYNLTAIGAKIVNFYRSPLKYAVDFDDWILFDNTGLKGYSAEWAKKNIEENKAPNLERMLVTDSRFQETFSTCNKVTYAVGFERRKSIILRPHQKLEYNKENGLIAPGLFGFGIAFPEGRYDQAGNYEYNVGLWKFMRYLENVLPMWLNS